MSDSPVETINMSSVNQEGRSSQLSITRETKIGEGSYGNIYEADAIIGNRARRFVIKKFKDTDYQGVKMTASENAANAMANYETAKKAGLKVFTTYRLGENGTSILMTSGNTESTVCIGNDPLSQLPARGLPKITNMTDEQFEGLADGVFDQALLAADKSISLHNDAFFFLFDKNTHAVDFILGDLDNVNDGRLPPNQSRILNNLNGAQVALKSFAAENIEMPAEFIQTVFEKYMQIRINQGYSNY